MTERITNEQREAIVRKAVAERDALLASRPSCKWPSCDCGIVMPSGKEWRCPKQTAHSAKIWESVSTAGVDLPAGGQKK